MAGKLFLSFIMFLNPFLKRPVLACLLRQFERPRFTHPYKTTGKIIFHTFEFLYFWIANWKIKDSAPKDSYNSLSSIRFYFLHECNFEKLGLFPKYFNFSTLSKDLALSLLIFIPLHTSRVKLKYLIIVNSAHFFFKFLIYVKASRKMSATLRILL
jgi:hypothetical protein